MVNPTQQSCKYVYGPVNSWRYGRSLGIDPIGLVSTCSFDCVYCQLGEIEQKVDPKQLQSINKPVNRVNLAEMWSRLQQFRFEFTGKLSIQTMVMFPWNYRDKRKYIDFMRSVRPDEIQLNTPTRPKPLKHQLDARGNLNRNDSSSLGDRVKILRPVSTEILQAFAAEIYESTGICVRFPTKAV